MTVMMLGTLRERIVGYLEMNPLATPAEIREALGSDADPVLIRQTLGRMVDGAILNKVGYGKYTLCPGYERRVKSVDQDIGDAICEYLTDQGGIAFTSDIHGAIWGGERGKTERPADYMRVQRVLRESPTFHQDFGRGVWNLDECQMALHPLPGRWAALVLGLPDAKQRDEFFVEVGDAFAEASGDLSYMDVGSDPKVAAALDQVARKAHRATSKAVAMQRCDVEAGEREYPLACYLYLLFEDGDPDMHLAAPASFYRGCARLFGGPEAADLSRGISDF